MLLCCAAALLVATLSPSAASAGTGGHGHHPHHSAHHSSEPTLLVSGLGSGSGSTVGPDGALYVAEPASGTIVRVDPRSGATSTYASGLPVNPEFGGGVFDVAFRGHTAYALVTLVAPDVPGGTGVAGLYRIDGPTAWTVVADIGAWAIAHPPPTDFFVASGVQYALQPWHHGFLVTDGHHNRVLRVTTRGDIRQVLQLANVVPTGIDTAGRHVLLALAGPVPHHPADGRVVTFRPGDTGTRTIAAGAPILTDVELADGGHGHGASYRSSHHGGHHGTAVYALSNGTFSGGPEGSPGLPDTGSLVRGNRYGGFDVVADGLDRPTSLELLHGRAYIVTLDGEVWTVPLHRH
jgi:hypothetical protein